MFAQAVFWCAAGIAVYTYFAYPILLVVLARFFRRPVRKASTEPSVSMVIAAYNEQDVIEDKIRNALQQDYPPDKLEIVVVSDGSQDATNRIVSSLSDGRRVRLVAFPENRGKVAALNDTVATLRSSVIVFSDASSMLQKDAVRHLAENFADAEVGAASGIYRVRRKREAELGEQEDFYWRYETFLKVCESRIGSVLGAHGSLYAIRRDLYPFPKAGTINDDYVIPVRILQRGYRVAYETSAVASEEAKEMAGFSRRIRVMAGNVEQLGEITALLWPPRWFPIFVFLSHKVARLLVPFSLVAAFVACAFLLDRPVCRWLWYVQIAFYASALLGLFFPTVGKLARLPYYFCMINAAAFCGIYYAIVKRGALTWKREG